MIPVVTLWTFHMKEQFSLMDRHWRVLDEEERLRAARYRYEVDRSRFVVARATLRRLLGNTLDMPPEAMVFSSNPFGKPELLARSALHFNTSHSGDWVLHAFSSSAPVGVDVEAVRDDWADLLASGQVLAPAEADWLASLDEPARPAAFTGLWVRKEAYVKALGEGLSRPLKEICVIPSSAGTHERLSERDHEVPLDALSLCPIELGTGYSACVAYLGPRPDIRIQPYGSGGRPTAL
jgi:4'-phosphopantetheinyl transferase